MKNLIFHVNKWLYLVLALMIVTPAHAATCRSVVGDWMWFTHGIVTIKPDGTMVYGGAKDTNDGTWKCTDSTKGHVTLRWRLGGYVNRLGISPDGRRLFSLDPSQAYVSAVRVGEQNEKKAGKNTPPPVHHSKSWNPYSVLSHNLHTDNGGKAEPSPKPPVRDTGKVPAPGLDKLKAIPSGGPWNRKAVYAAIVARLKKEIAHRPGEARPLVELAAFYLKPLAPRMVAAADGKVRRVMVPLRNERRGYTKNIYAVPWVFRGDTRLAEPLLRKALQISPHDPYAIREMAMLLRMKGNVDAMRPYMEAALKHNPLDLDMCRLALDYYTARARVLDDQAVTLRTPTHSVKHEAGGDYDVTVYPSKADLARARQLHAQAQRRRLEAVAPLHNLASLLQKNHSTPARKSEWYLATAIYYDWIGELDKAAGTAVAALRADPTNLDALDFVVDILRGTHTFDKMRQYKAILDRWEGADSKPIIVKSAPRGPRA